MNILFLGVLVICSGISMQMKQEESSSVSDTTTETSVEETDSSVSNEASDESSNAEEEEETSQISSAGRIGEGIEEVGSKITDFSTKANENLENLSEQMDIQQDINSDSAESLLNVEIDKLNIQISSIDDQIAALEETLELLKKNCNNLENCWDCTSNDECVWCSIEKKCYIGDALGPSNGECTEFQYSSCSSHGCEQYNSCDVCLSDTQCGWCAKGEYCLSGHGFYSDVCEDKYFFHQEGQNECPEPQINEKDIDYNDDEISEIESNIEYLEDSKDELYEEINDLERQITTIIRKAAKTVDIAGPIDGNDYDGFSETVDEQAEEEKEDERDYQEEIWDWWANNTSTEISETVETEYDGLVESLESYQVEDEEDTAEATTDESTTESTSESTTEEDSVVSFLSLMIKNK